jgi:hypothetical protein
MSKKPACLMNPTNPRRAERHGRLPEDWDKISFVALWSYLNRRQRTPTTIEAIMYAVRERGVAALKESANIERLLLCDDAARTEINERIGRLIAEKETGA